MRPVRVAARRQREMMVILRHHLNGESAEWLDVEDIDIDSDNFIHESSAQGAAASVMPLIGNIQHGHNFLGKMFDAGFGSFK